MRAISMLFGAACLALAAQGPAAADPPEAGLRLILGVAQTEASTDQQKAAQTEMIAALGRRLAAFGLPKTRVSAQGDDRIRVDLPATPPLDRNVLLRPGRVALYLEARDDWEGPTERLDFSRRYNPHDDPPLRLESPAAMPEVLIREAQPSFDLNGLPGVALSISDRDALGALTQQAVGRRLALTLDGEILTAPIVVAPIPNGAVILTGAFTPNEARALAALLSAPPLPGRLELLEERVIGPKDAGD